MSSFSVEAALPKRQRCVILLADLVESVVLMQQFENEVIQAWRSFESQVRQRMRAHAGRVVRTAGDSMLLTFETAPAALHQAFALHELAAQASSPLPDAARLWLRIGLHVAEVLHDGHEIYGAGVNLAARVSGAALPGQTWLSIEMRDALVDDVDAQLVDLGERYLKHYDQPIRLFRAEPLGTSVERRPPPHPGDETLRPILAVVPLRASKPGPADAAGHALADALAGSLAGHPSLRVQSLASSARLRDAECTPTGMRALEHATGAHYLLGGRCTLQGKRLHAELNLLSLRSGEQLACVPLDCDLAALFATSADALGGCVTQLLAHLDLHAVRHACLLPMGSLPSYQVYAAAHSLSGSLVPAEFDRARAAFELLAERHPRQPAPHGMLARWHVLCVVQGWQVDETQGMRLAREHALRATELDPRNAVALSALALQRMRFEHHVDEARALNAEAIACAPQDPWAWAQQASVLAYLDQGEAAAESAHEALRRSPLDPSRYLFETYVALAELAAGRPLEAASWARQSLSRQALHASAHRLLIGALVIAGQETEAQAALAAYRQHTPTAASRPTPITGAGPAWRRQLDDALTQVVGHP